MRKKFSALWYWVENLAQNNWICTGFLLLTVFWTFFSYDLPSVGLECLIIACLFLFLRVRKDKLIRLTIPALVLCLCALALLFFSGKLGERGFNAPISHTLKLIFLLFVQVAAFVMFNLKEAHHRGVLLFSFAVLFLSTAVSVYFVFFVDQYALRYFADRGFYQVFDFNQMYALPIVIASLACLVLAKAKSFLKALPYFVFLLLAVACCCLSLYATAMFLMAIGVGVAFLFSQFYRSPKRFWIITGVLVGSVALCLLFRQQVADLIYAFTEEMNWLIKARIRLVADMLLGTGYEGWYSLDRRNELAGYSISSFLSNPLFGIGYATYGYGTIGGHQEWYDMLGVFGIFGSAVFVGIMVLWSVWTFRKAKTVVDKASFLISLGLFVFLGFLNPVLNLPVLVAVFLIAPNISALPMEWAWVKESLSDAREKLAGLRRKGEK